MTLTKTYDFTDDRDNGIKILASRVDTVIDEIIAATNNKLDKDGSVTPTSNQPMGGLKHTGVGNASARDQYVSAAQFQDNSIIYGGTAGGTANAITFSVTPAITAYTSGQRFLFIAAGTNTNTTTVNVNSVGAKNIFKNGIALVGGEIVSGKLYEITYDGTQFNITGVAAGVNNMADYVLQRPLLKDYGEVVSNLGSVSGAVTLDISTANHFSMTLTGNVTLTVTNPSPTGNLCPLTIWATQDATGGRTFTYPASFVNPQALSGTASKLDILTYLSKDAGTNWYNTGAKLAL